MNVFQLDLFDDNEPVSAVYAAPVESTITFAPILNGIYYEKNTDKFVSFAFGERHYEFPAKGCGHSKEWQERTKKERCI